LSEMNASGEYVVKIRDASGVDATKKLSDVTQQEFDNLIKEPTVHELSITEEAIEKYISTL